MPLVSVVVLNYNYARYLPERMESIFSQTFQDYEVILLDDCSTDNSKEIIEQYRNHPKVSAIVYNDQNSGSPFKQWRKGVEMAKGKYVWIAESDDSAKPEFLATGVNLLEENPEAVLAFMGADIMDGDGKKLDEDFDRWSRKQSSSKGYRVLDGNKYIKHNMYWRPYVYNASGTVFRREWATPDKFEICGKMRNAGDWLFWTMMLKDHKTIEVYKKLNIYRMHNNNATRKGMISGNVKLEDIKVMQYIEQHFRIGAYRKAMRHGLFMKQVRRWDYSPELKAEIFGSMKERLGATEREYKLQRINKFFWHIFPFLLTEKNDRI